MSNTGACPLAKPVQAMARLHASGEALPRCGREHSAVPNFLPPTTTARREHEMFAAALEGCLTCVRYYVEAEGIPLHAVGGNCHYTALDWAQWASAQYGTDTQAVQRYLRMRVHAAQGLVPVVFSGPTAEGDPPRDPHGGEHRLRAGAAVFGQTQGPSAGSSAFPMTPLPPAPTRGRAKTEQLLHATAEAQQHPAPELHMQRVSRYGQWHGRRWFVYDTEVDATGITLFWSTFDDDRDLQRLRQPRGRTPE